MVDVLTEIIINKPLDEVIQSVSKVNKQMAPCIKCTGKGGLSITKTALDLKDNLLY